VVRRKGVELISANYFVIIQELHLCHKANSRDEHRTSNIELPTSNEKQASTTEQSTLISVSSSFPIQYSMLDVGCSMFIFSHRYRGGLMKRQLVKAFVITFFTLISVSGNGADLRSLVESKKNGIIDWTAGVVEARGIGIPATYDAKSLAQREDLLSDAISKAGHNLLETVVSLRINSRDRVIDIVENFPSIMTQLRDMAQKAPELERLRKYQYDGSVEVWSQMSLSGGFAQLILPPEIRQIEPIKQVLKPNSPSRSQTRSRSRDIFTGMVVDARGIQAVPVLAPRVLDENLEEVFGPAYVSREFAVQRGMVSYTTDLWRAKFDPRVSENPLIVKALKSLWPGRCEFIISNADAAKLRSASEHLLFMRECRVIIVLDAM
jgi:hypothetical protein